VTPACCTEKARRPEKVLLYATILTPLQNSVDFCRQYQMSGLTHMYEDVMVASDGGTASRLDHDSADGINDEGRARHLHPHHVAVTHNRSQLRHIHRSTVTGAQSQELNHRSTITGTPEMLLHRRKFAPGYFSIVLKDSTL
jgi:hypothetical protein